MLAQRIDQLIRERFGGSQRAFARACGVDPRRVTGWLYENDPNVDNLRDIATAAGVSADWLLGFDVPEKQNEQLKRSDLSASAAEYFATEVAAAVRGEEWAIVLASYIPDGAAFLRSAVERELDGIRGAWRDAETLARSWDPLVDEVEKWPVQTRDNLSPEKRRRFLRGSLESKRALFAWRLFAERFRSPALKRAEPYHEERHRIPPQLRALSGKARGTHPPRTERAR